MTLRKPGMDHAHYAADLWPARAELLWPNRARLAVTLFLAFEYWEMDPPDGTLRDPRFKDANGYFHPDQFTVSLMDYGNRVGVFRILDLLDRTQLKVTVAANAQACVRFPWLLAEFLRRGYEIAAHGTYATRMISSLMSEAEERAAIAQTLATIEQATGTRPRGWIGQDYGESVRTPALLAEAGMSYVADWPNDEQPYRLRTAPQIISIPQQPDWDDVQLLWHRRVSVLKYPDLVMTAAERLSADGATSGRFMGLFVHPWVLGAPHRIRYLEEAVTRLVTLPDLWLATAADIAEHADSILERPCT